MPSFGELSTSRILTCEQGLIAVFQKVVSRVDCSVLEGVRSDERQIQLYHDGASTKDGVIRKSNLSLIHI